jgi:hypothetical protein
LLRSSPKRLFTMPRTTSLKNMKQAPVPLTASVSLGVAAAAIPEMDRSASVPVGRGLSGAPDTRDAKDVSRPASSATATTGLRSPVASSATFFLLAGAQLLDAQDKHSLALAASFDPRAQQAAAHVGGGVAGAAAPADEYGGAGAAVAAGGGGGVSAPGVGFDRAAVSHSVSSAAGHHHAWNHDGGVMVSPQPPGHLLRTLLNTATTTPYKRILQYWRRAPTSSDAGDATYGAVAEGYVSDSDDVKAATRRRSLQPNVVLYRGYLKKSKDLNMGMWHVKYVEIRPGMMVYASDPNDINNPRRASAIEFNARNCVCRAVTT